MVNSDESSIFSHGGDKASSSTAKIHLDSMQPKIGFFAGIADNPLFAGGVGVACMGMGMAVLRQGMASMLLGAQRHFTTSIEITSRDRSYGWILSWISANAIRSQHLAVETSFVQHANGGISTKFELVPSPGKHFVWYKHHLIQVQRDREKTMIDLSKGTPWETVTMTCLGRNTSIYSSLLQEAKLQAMQKEDGKIVIYTPSMTDWKPFGQPRKRRALHSVVLHEGISEKILNDVQDFVKSSKYYSDRGIPYRRGYLLYGPPGSGKSSFIQALAGELGYNICLLSLNDRGLSDDRLSVLMANTPPRSIVLLEDVDAAFVNRSNQERSYNVTFSGLLNMLDGVASSEERIMFLTTNHIEKLDAALIRPGRVDVQMYIGNATPYQQKKMFINFFRTFDPPIESLVDSIADTSFQPGINSSQKQADVKSLEVLADEFVQLLSGRVISPAELQGIFTCCKNQPVECLNMIRTANEQHKLTN
jgi:chaperone BCS1